MLWLYSAGIAALILVVGSLPLMDRLKLPRFVIATVAWSWLGAAILLAVATWPVQGWLERACVIGAGLVIGPAVLDYARGTQE